MAVTVGVGAEVLVPTVEGPGGKTDGPLRARPEHERQLPGTFLILVQPSVWQVIDVRLSPEAGKALVHGQRQYSKPESFLHVPEGLSMKNILFEILLNRVCVGYLKKEVQDTSVQRNHNEVLTNSETRQRGEDDW